MSDLPAPSTSSSDKYTQFALSLPFARIQVNHFIVKAKIAEQQAGAEGYVTLETLRGELTTPAWADLGDENSTLSKFLLSAAFKKDGQEADQIDCESLIIFALLNSPGKPADKAEHVYNILQDGAGTADAIHSHMTASDKDLAPFFDKLCDLTCCDLIVQADAIGAVDNEYDEDELA
jgi:hypothetical protein